MYINFNEEAYCKCSNCGQAAEVDTVTVLASDPPKYNCYCPYCHTQGYVLCKEVFYDTKVAQLIEGTSISFVAPCLVCGESVSVSMLDNHSKICEKCKKAILKLRKMLEEE